MVDDGAPARPGAVGQLPAGGVAQLQADGAPVGGFDCVFGGTIPMGAGLSSSAAVECGPAFALNQLFDLGLAPLALAQIAQRAKHAFAGVECGLMDQFASLMGRAGHVVRLDCHSLDYQYFPFDTAAARIVLCNSGVKHNLADSEYNVRRRQCEQGVAALRRHYPHVQTLRDVSSFMLASHRAALDATVYRRCRYVVAENDRVLAACDYLMAGNMAMAVFGRQLYVSHAGLRDDYEVSCPELDALVDLARELPGVFGARMMGGGFGGYTVNLVAPARVEAFVTAVSAGFSARFGRPLETYQTTIVAGVDAVPVLVTR